MFMYPLRRHVVRSADQRVRRCRLVAEKAAETEVAELNDTLGGDKNVGGLDIWKQSTQCMQYMTVSLARLNFGAICLCKVSIKGWWEKVGALCLCSEKLAAKEQKT